LTSEGLAVKLDTSLRESISYLRDSVLHRAVVSPEVGNVFR
jgi:hypothetical protein